MILVKNHPRLPYVAEKNGMTVGLMVEANEPIEDLLACIATHLGPCWTLYDSEKTIVPVESNGHVFQVAVSRATGWRWGRHGQLFSFRDENDALLFRLIVAP